jgi:2-(1,2-epoxy-1,2-dihydrophenyl)acetyl-CoA isomerase
VTENRTHGDVVTALDDDHVALVEIRRGPDNHIDVGLATDLADAIVALDGTHCRAIVLASDGTHFCGGGRLTGDAGDLPTGDRNPLYDQCVRLFHGAIPIVAAVQGAAVGAGLGLALAADFRVASPSTRFGPTFSRLGLHQGFGTTVTLPRLIGPQRAAELLLTGRKVHGDEALAIGLCDRLVEPEQLRQAARALALEIAAAAPLAVRAIRRTLRQGLAAAVEAATLVEHAEQRALVTTDDFRQGVLATRERRSPTFTGR